MGGFFFGILLTLAGIFFVMGLAHSENKLVGFLRALADALDRGISDGT